MPRFFLERQSKQRLKSRIEDFSIKKLKLRGSCALDCSEYDKDLQDIPYLYVTFYESETLIHATERVLGKAAFFLSTGNEKNLVVIKGEWLRLLARIKNILA